MEENSLLVEKEEGIIITQNILSNTNYNTLTDSQPDNLIAANPTKPPTTIDKIVDEIGHSYYHITIYIIAVCTLFSNGVIMNNIYVISPILQKQYDVSNDSMSLVITSYFFGSLIGFFLAGTLVRKFGRVKLVITSIILMGIFNPLSVVVDSLVWISGCRLILGIAYGLSTTTNSAFLEILPTTYRSFMMLTLLVYTRLGKMMFIVICYFMIDDKNSSLWKHTICISTIPIYLAIILALVFYEESPRLLFVKGEIEEGFKKLDNLAQKSDMTISLEDKDQILKQIKASHINSNPSICELFGDFFSTPMITVLLIFIMSFVFFIGSTLEMELPTFYKYYTPNIENKTNYYSSSNLLDMIRSTIFPLTFDAKTKANILSSNNLKDMIKNSIFPLTLEIVGGFLSSIKWLGRKNLLTICFFVCGITSLIQVVASPEIYYVFNGLCAAFTGLATSIAVIYSVEAYTTYIRDFAYGLLVAIAKLFSLFIPFWVEGLFSIGIMTSSIAVAILCFIAAVLAMFLPFDTYKKDLEQENKPNTSNNEKTEEDAYLVKQLDIKIKKLEEDDQQMPPNSSKRVF